MGRKVDIGSVTQPHISIFFIISIFRNRNRNGSRVYSNSNMARVLISSAFSLLSSSSTCSSPYHSPNSSFFPSPNKVVLRNGAGCNLICHQQSGATADKSVLEGVITESVSNGMYLVSLENGSVIVGYVSGKIRQRSIQILPGDKVRIELSHYDSTKGRITYRTTKDDPERRDIPKTKAGKNKGRRN